MDLDAKLISLEGLELGKKEDKIQLSLGRIFIDSTNFNIYRDKTITMTLPISLYIANH